MPTTNAKSNKHPVIKCESVYKIFGDNAERLMREANGNIDVETFESAGCIFGVNGASFEVYKGEILIVMGLSGSGKSTLLRCISRLTEATAGKIYIDGDDLLAMSSKELIELRRNKMGMVFQSFALLPHKTVLENIAFPLQIKGMGTQESVKKASSMIELVGLSGRENYFPRQLSGGQQQRVAIARALSLDPKIMLFDEPTSALDPELVGDVLKVMKDLKDGGMTMMVVSHEMRFARAAADRIIFMDEGNIIEQGTPQQLFENPQHQRTRDFLRQVEH